MDMNKDMATLPKKVLKTRPYNIGMEKMDLKRRIKPTPPPRTGKWENVKPKLVPRKSVNEDVYKPIPKPRTDRPLQIPKIKKLN